MPKKAAKKPAPKKQRAAAKTGRVAKKPQVKPKNTPGRVKAQRWPPS